MSHAALTVLLAYLAGVIVMAAFWPKALRHPKIRALTDSIEPQTMAVALTILTLTWPVTLAFAFARARANRSKS